MRPQISINIVTWNSMKYLPELLASLSTQEFTDFQVIIIDNASDDGTADFVRTTYPQVAFIRNAKNLGFCRAHNQGIRYAIEHWKSEDLSQKFVLLTNPDIIFEKDTLKEFMEGVRRHQDGASFSPKLRRAFIENPMDEQLTETMKSDIIDSTGIRAHKNRTFTDRGAGEIDEGQYDEEGQIFGPPGALALFRASELNEVKVNDQYIDEKYFAYKEDIDLAWRMRLFGMKAYYLPKAIAYHHRGMYGKESAGFIEKWKNRRKKPRMRSFYSNRNHWILLMKNMHFTNVFLAFPRILWAESLRFFYTLFFETKNTKAFIQALAQIGSIRKDRTEIFRKRKVKAKEIRAWF